MVSDGSTISLIETLAAIEQVSTWGLLVFVVVGGLMLARLYFTSRRQDAQVIGQFTSLQTGLVTALNNQSQLTTHTAQQINASVAATQALTTQITGLTGQMGMVSENLQAIKDKMALDRKMMAVQLEQLPAELNRALIETFERHDEAQTKRFIDGITHVINKIPQHLTVGVMSVSPEGTVSAVNNELLALTGLTPDVVGRNLFTDGVVRVVDEGGKPLLVAQSPFSDLLSGDKSSLQLIAGIIPPHSVTQEKRWFLLKAAPAVTIRPSTNSQILITFTDIGKLIHAI
jgi:conjugal transfer/entry exclusion protein